MVVFVIMRYPPEQGNKNSKNISERQLLGYSSSATSSSANSGASGLSSQDNGEASPDVSNIATISERVLFGKDNGQNSFLYMYYSRSTPDNSASESRRPFTAQGSDDKVGGIGKGMGSQKQWNDLSGGLDRGRGSAGPTFPPTFLNSNEEDNDIDYDGTTLKPINRIIHTDNTPYPVYVAPQEEPISPSKRGESRKRERIEMEKEEENAEERSRPESLTEGLLQGEDNDWNKISPIPDVTPRYPYTPGRRGSGRKSENRESQHKDIFAAEPTIPATHESGSLGASKHSLKASGRSPTDHNIYNYHNPSRSSKRVRVTPDEGNEAGSRRSMKKLSPVSSAPSTSSTRSLQRVYPNSQHQHGVTHHHHQPHTGNSSNVNANMTSGTNQTKRVSTTTTSGDGIDHMSFLNGIGAYFGTPASKQLSQSHEPTPEEIYQQELQGWKPRLATSGMIFSATMFILSSCSLLFVFPILVDPILVGFEAQFSLEPVMCRTTLFRNGTGSSECAIPSCREGCTIDLFSCMFIHVEYTPTINNSGLGAADNVKFVPHNTSANTNLSSAQSQADASPPIPTRRSGVLLININGCGYPPEVTCSDFGRRYGSIDSEYPCYYSQQNGSIVVPHYSRNTELFHLTLAVCIPVGVVVLSAISLYSLVRYHAYLKTTIYRSYVSRKKALKERNAKLTRDGEEDNNEDDDDDDIEKDVTSISELELDEDEEYDYDFKEIPYPTKNHKELNGASKTGIESRTMLRSTQM